MDELPVKSSVSHDFHKTKLVFIRFGVASFVLIVIFCAYAGLHWFRAVSEYDEEGLAEQAGAYLSDFYDFYESSYITDIRSATVTILKTEKRGNYLAALCRNSNGRYYACVFERDSLFHDRWRVNGGGGGSYPGEINSWNAGLMGDAVLVFFGAELPDDAAWYRFKNSGVTYICPVENHSVLNLFVILDTADINGTPELLDEAYNAII